MLKQKLQSDATQALKAKNQFLLETLRLLVASINTKEKDKKYKEKIEGEAQLTDEEIIDVLSSEVKKRKDAIALYTQGNRPELAEKESKEIEVIKKYLPEQLSEEVIRKLVQESVEKIRKEMSASGGSALGGKDMGKVMADLNPKVKGKAEGSVVSKIVKELLGK